MPREVRVIRGVSNPGRRLYLVTTGTVLEIEEPRKALLAGRETEPATAAAALLGLRARIVLSGGEILIEAGPATAEISAEDVEEIPVVRIIAPSLALAEWASREVAPGVPYYDVLDRAPELAVPRWADPWGVCRRAPIFRCPRAS